MRPRPWSGVVVVAVLFQMGCVAGVVGNAALNAALNTGIAVGASAVSRSQGGCYASCPAGTRCNKTTGYCETIPCRGECDPFEECIEEKFVYRCVARSPGTGKIIVNPPQTSSSEQKPSEQKPSEQKPEDPKP